MAIEFTRPGERKVNEFVSDVLKTYKEGRTGLTGATTAISMAMHYAAHDDPKLATHMENWLNATRRQPEPAL